MEQQEFRLMVVTSEADLPDEMEVWEALRKSGMKYLHLRKPHWDARQMSVCLDGLSPELRACVHLHDCHELAMRYGVAGIHLNARHTMLPAGYTGYISRSCHSLEEVVRYKSCCNYVFLSPIFDSISKSGHDAAFTVKALREAAAKGVIDHRVIGMGGVTADRLPSMRNLGFGGAAVLGALWKPYERRPDAAVAQAEWNEFRISRLEMARTKRK